MITRRALLLALFLYAGNAIAQTAQGVGGNVEAKMIGDHLLIRVALQTEVFYKDTHVIVDYASDKPFEIFQNIFNAVGFGENETSLKVLGDDFRLDIPRGQVLPSAESTLTMGYLTSRYSKELEDIDVAALIGAPMLDSLALQLDIEAGELSLMLAGSTEPSAFIQGYQSVVSGVRQVDGQILIPVTHGKQPTAFMSFETAGYHTSIRPEAAEPAGWPEPLRGLYFGQQAPGDLEISEMAALFPRDLGEETPDDLFVRSGLSLWSGYRFLLDPVRGLLGITPVVDSNFTQADHDFYLAAVAEDRGALKTYLGNYPESRNVIEAAELLYELGLAEGVSHDEQMEAIQIRLSQTLTRLKADYLAGAAQRLFFSDQRDSHSELIVALCEELLNHVDRSANPVVRQNAQLMLGDRYLDAGDAMQAWKYFLSAGFSGHPDNEGVVRHELGRVYEALGRHRRAYSNYARAADEYTPAPPPIKESAKEAMARLTPLLAEDDPLLEEGADS